MKLATDVTKGVHPPLDLLLVDVFNGKDNVPATLCSAGMLCCYNYQHTLCNAATSACGGEQDLYDLQQGSCIAIYVDTCSGMHLLPLTFGFK